MKRYIFLVALILLSDAALATTENNVTIVYLNINRDAGQVYIRTSEAPVASGCHTDTNWNYTFLFDHEYDKAVYATLLAAKMAGKSVLITGYDACPSHGYQQVEEVRWVTILN